MFKSASNLFDQVQVMERRSFAPSISTGNSFIQPESGRITPLSPQSPRSPPESVQSNSLRRRGTRRFSNVSIAQMSSMVSRQSQSYGSSSVSLRTSDQPVRDDRIYELELSNEVYKNILNSERDKNKTLSMELKSLQRKLKVQSQEKELAELRLQKLYLERDSVSSCYEDETLETAVTTDDVGSDEFYEIKIPIPEPTTSNFVDQDSEYSDYESPNVVNIEFNSNNESIEEIGNFSTDNVKELNVTTGNETYEEASEEPTEPTEETYEETHEETHEEAHEDSNEVSNKDSNEDSNEYTFSPIHSPILPLSPIQTFAQADISPYLVPDPSPDTVSALNFKPKSDGPDEKCKSSATKRTQKNNVNRHSAIIGNKLLEVDMFGKDASTRFDFPKSKSHSVYHVSTSSNFCTVRYVASAISKPSTDGIITRAQPSFDAPTVSCRVGRTFNSPLGGKSHGSSSALKESPELKPHDKATTVNYWGPFFGGFEDDTGSGHTGTRLHKTVARARKNVIVGRSSVAAYHA